VLGVQGTLREAEELVTAALDQLALDAPWARGDALRVLGDIHLAAGDFAKAEKAYCDAYAIGWDPQPGFAMLLLERGEAEAAYRGLERSLESRGWPTLQRRGLLLASLAKVAARTGRTERAHQIVAELETRPGRWPMPSIKALTAEAKAELLIRANRPDEAIRELRAASALWRDVAAAINAAEACLSVAALLIDAGDLPGADLELKAAQQVAERVGSRRLLDRAERLATRTAAEADPSRQPIRSAGA
jgi:ATP/maltotriose-dependent transcriptional regulator MalT